MNHKLSIEVKSASKVTKGIEERSGATVKLSEAVFGSPCLQSVLHQVVVWQLANRRQGTRKTKRKAEVALSKAKPWKQKGTGRARAGTVSSPLWVGGGVAHGPQPFVYNGKVPRKVKQSALKGALTAKANDNSIMVVDSFDGFSGKTKEMSGFLKGLGVVNTKSGKANQVLIVTGTGIDMVRRSTNNIPKVKVLPADGLNVYDLLNARKVVFDNAGLKLVEERLAGVSEAADS